MALFTVDVERLDDNWTPSGLETVILDSSGPCSAQYDAMAHCFQTLGWRRCRAGDAIQTTTLGQLW